MKIKFSVLALLLALAVSQVAAQEDYSSGEDQSQFKYPSVFIKFSPLALLELPQPAFQAAVEYKLSWPFFLQHELGWMPPLPGGLFERGSSYHGGKFKTEIRMYLEEEYSPNFISKATYLAFEGMYRVRRLHTEDWYTMDGGSFRQWIEMYQNRQQVAFHFKYGRNVKLSPRSNIYVDSYIGIGLRRYFANYQYITEDVLGTPDFLRDSYNFVSPSVALGFKIGFGL